MDVSCHTINNTLSDIQFSTISELMYQISGVTLGQGKEELVKARLIKRLRALNLTNFDDYISLVKSGKTSDELLIMTDALTTNKTSFFREEQHFLFINQVILPSIARFNKALRVWSAGCSSGEEPYSIAIHLRENIPNLQAWNIKILATDISTTVLSKAKEGIYSEEIIRDVPASLQAKYFTKTASSPENLYRVNDLVRSMIKFAQLNLMGPWPMKGPFDVIFCRNVMIYFDKPTREKLVSRYFSLLKPGGYLFVGHSESLTGTRTQFKYVQPAVYVKEYI
jgi:chemotaxis protein methyltransferase CheR